MRTNFPNLLKDFNLPRGDNNRMGFRYMSFDELQGFFSFCRVEWVLVSGIAIRFKFKTRTKLRLLLQCIHDCEANFWNVSVYICVGLNSFVSAPNISNGFLRKIIVSKNSQRIRN